MNDHSTRFRAPRCFRPLAIACALALSAGGATPAAASTAYGDLNNFDVFNDTGQECHGFEIELDDVHSTDITYTFDWNHYGAPTITEDTSNPLHPKVFVRYAAKYVNGSFAAFTAVPAAPPSPTDGHMCTDITVNFGCEHFGVGYYGTPTAVKYHWLIEDPTSPGNLIHGPAVNVATPAWTYFPPAPAQPVAQVQAVILAPPPPEVPVYEFGDAVWVKSIVTTSHNNNPVELADLVSDDPDDPSDVNWTNGEPDEVEVEWHILQTEFNNPNGANNELAGGAEDLTNGDEIVTRRYEFYKYTGPLDPETNEAKCDNYPQIADPADPSYKPECDPADVTILGDYIGAQMAGFNVEAVLGLIDHIQDGTVGEAYVPRTVVVGGNTPYVTEISAGALPPDVAIDSTTGVLTGTPSSGGVYTFSVKATDADQVQATKSYTVTIADTSVDLCAGVVCTASDGCHVAGVCDPASGTCSNPIADDGTICNDGNVCTPTDTCQGGVCVGTGANPVCGSADLSIKVRTASQVHVGSRIDDVLQVKNAGPDGAAAVVAAVTCGGTAFHVGTVPTGCTVSGATVTCALGTFAKKQSAEVTVTFVPDAAGELSCTAGVSSDTSDPVPTNQTKTFTTRVR